MKPQVTSQSFILVTNHKAIYLFTDWFFIKNILKIKYINNTIKLKTQSWWTAEVLNKANSSISSPGCVLQGNTRWASGLSLLCCVLTVFFSCSQFTLFSHRTCRQLESWTTSSVTKEHQNNRPSDFLTDGPLIVWPTSPLTSGPYKQQGLWFSDHLALWLTGLLIF